MLYLCDMLFTESQSKGTPSRKGFLQTDIQNIEKETVRNATKVAMKDWQNRKLPIWRTQNQKHANGTAHLI